MIDREQVDEHVAELKRQLDACRSVMAWVQAWNSHAGRFFSTNFSEPANCFGRQHNDMTIEALSHMQRSLFANFGAANVTEYLRRVLKERFGMDDTVPDGFFYFPTELGGLGLKNPFINAFATYKETFPDPSDRIERGFEEEPDANDAAKERWDTGATQRSQRRKSNSLSEESFMSFEEYIMYCEECSEPLCRAYLDLLNCPAEGCAQMYTEMNVVLRASEYSR